MEKEGSRRRVPVAEMTMAEMVCVRAGVWAKRLESRITMTML